MIQLTEDEILQVFTKYDQPCNLIRTAYFEPITESAAESLEWCIPRTGYVEFPLISQEQLPEGVWIGHFKRVEGDKA